MQQHSGLYKEVVSECSKRFKNLLLKASETEHFQDITDRSSKEKLINTIMPKQMYLWKYTTNRIYLS